MKEKKKKRGGKRAGAGRKPSGRQNEAVTVYTDVSRFGGKEGTRMAIYAFLDGGETKAGHQIVFKPVAPDSFDGAKTSFQDEPEFPIPALKSQERPKIKLQPLIHPDAPMAVTGKPKTLDELKGMCPAELKGLDRSEWIRTQRQKYGI